MKLHSATPTDVLSITSYDRQHIAVSGRSLQESFLLTPERLIERWTTHTFDTLTEQDMEPIAELGSPIVLFGTGERQRFPPPALLRPLIDKRIGVEVMDNFAACRTYNILLAEARDVVLAVLIDPVAAAQ